MTRNPLYTYYGGKMMHKEFYMGVVVGLGMAMAYTLWQPRVTEHNISVTFEKPFKTELSVEPVLAGELK